MSFTMALVIAVLGWLVLAPIAAVVWGSVARGGLQEDRAHGRLVDGR